MVFSEEYQASRGNLRFGTHQRRIISESLKFQFDGIKLCDMNMETNDSSQEIIEFSPLCC